MSCCTAQFRGTLGILNLPHVPIYLFSIHLFPTILYNCTHNTIQRHSLFCNYHARTHTLDLIFIIPFATPSGDSE